MQVTRRFWAVTATALLFVVGAVVVERPLLFAGGVGLGAWLLAAQYRFTTALAHTDDVLSVDLALTPPRVATDDQTHATLVVSLDAAVPIPLSVRVSRSVGTTGSATPARTVHLGAGAHEVSTTFDVAAPVAGTYEFDQPIVTARDPAGLFIETLARGPTPMLTVEPRTPRDVHVGEGDEAVAVAFGEHETGRLGSGIKPAEIRQYTPGDQAHRIDWKVTARLNHPYVREYESETDRVSALVVDHRAPMGQGPAGETKLDYARQVALAFVTSARTLDDPLGLYTVGDEGTTGAWQPSATPGQYETVRRQLHILTTTGDPSLQRTPHARERSPAEARNAAKVLDDDETTFATTLRPYFAGADPYVARIEDDPLFGTVRTRLAQLGGRVWTVLFTDDTNRAEVRETIKIARRGDNRVLVFLTPSILFESGGLTDLERAYDRYVDFEEFRRDLAKLSRVTAFEIAPGDRLDAVLGTGRRRRERRTGVQR